MALSASLASSKKPDTRFQWSAERFAAQCGYNWADYPKAKFQLFTDHDYSNKWRPISRARYDTCENCYRTAEVRYVNGVPVAQLTMSSESGDWYYFVSYCFDPAGKLKGLSTIYNTSQWSYVGVYAYGSALKLLEENWQELMSGKKIARPEGAGEFKAHWRDTQVYKTFAELPFAKLVTEPNAQTN